MSAVYGIAFNSICGTGNVLRREGGDWNGIIGTGFKADIIKVTGKPILSVGFWIWISINDIVLCASTFESMFEPKIDGDEIDGLASIFVISGEIKLLGVATSKTDFKIGRLVVSFFCFPF